MRKIKLSLLDSLFSAINSEVKLYLPTDGKTSAEFTEWTPDSKLSKSLNTNKSPKDFFFPQSEDLMGFKVDGKSIEVLDIRSESEDFAIFGVRACDVKAFEVLDNVFLSEPVDSFYKNRREHGIIISLACNRPDVTCFCGTFCIDAASPEGDIVSFMSDDSLYLEAKSEKGDKLLSKLLSVTESADASEALPIIDKIHERLEKLPLASLSAKAFGPDKTAKFFDAPEWEELSESCLGCGSCTFNCPTCQCYDIKDFNTGKGVIRYRCWDSCMYSEFTKMSAGQPRLTQKERFRQRFMHKLVYYPENNEGLFSCVGCGRCLTRCPIGMNIVKVMKKLGGKNNA